MKMGFEKKKSTKYLMNLSQIEEYSKFDKLKKSVLVFIVSQLAENEIGDLKNLFFEVDKDEDGVLSFLDFATFVNSLDLGKNELEIKGIFEGLDMSKTGFIDYNGKYCEIC